DRRVDRSEFPIPRLLIDLSRLKSSVDPSDRLDGSGRAQGLDRFLDLFGHGRCSFQNTSDASTARPPVSLAGADHAHTGKFARPVLGSMDRGAPCRSPNLLIPSLQTQEEACLREKAARSIV